MDNITPYRFNFFQLSSFLREHVPLLGANVPIGCFSQTVCRPNRASFFHLSAFLRYMIVITIDKSLTWLIFHCFLLQVLQMKRWMINNDMIDYMRIRHLLLCYSYVNSRFEVFFRNLPLSRVYPWNVKAW